MGKVISKALINKTESYLFDYPHVTVSQTLKNCVKRLLGREVYKHNKLSWQNGICALGLLEYIKCCYDDKDIAVAVKQVKKYYDANKNTQVINSVEDCLSVYVLLEMIDNGYLNEDEYRRLIEKVYSFILDARKDSVKSLVYNQRQKENYIFADMIGMACPFLVKYGVMYNVPEAIELGIVQIDNFFNLAIEEMTDLPFHAYELEDDTHGAGNLTGKKLGQLGWGRAVGWIAMGLANSLEGIKLIGDGADDNLNVIAKLNGYLERIAKLFMSYQMESGLVNWALTEEGPEDTSATAMIVYSMIKYINYVGSNGESDVNELGDLKEAVDNGITALEKHIKADGSVDQCHAECLGLGMHPQKYGSYPWSVGPTLAVMSLKEREL